jgi:AcrR family transcriptional regulator
MATKVEGTARERLLQAANELFYAEGVHSVGIDRVIEHAGVAKASLYSTFGSKDELVRAYLDARAARKRDLITQRIAKLDSPRARMLAVFDLLAESVADPTYRGCAFVNASAEGGAAVRPSCTDYRKWIRSLFVDLARDHGASSPDELAEQLVLIYDGAIVGAAMDSAPARATAAKRLAVAVIDSAPVKKSKKK